MITQMQEKFQEMSDQLVQKNILFSGMHLFFATVLALLYLFVHSLLLAML